MDACLADSMILVSFETSGEQDWIKARMWDLFRKSKRHALSSMNLIFVFSLNYHHMPSMIIYSNSFSLNYVSIPYVYLCVVDVYLNSYRNIIQGNRSLLLSYRSLLSIFLSFDLITCAYVST